MAPWQAQFFGGATAEDIFTAADGTEQRADFMHIAIEGSPVRKGAGYRCASLYLKAGAGLAITEEAGILKLKGPEAQSNFLIFDLPE